MKSSGGWTKFGNNYRKTKGHESFGKATNRIPVVPATLFLEAAKKVRPGIEARLALGQEPEFIYDRGIAIWRTGQEKQPTGSNTTFSSDGTRVANKLVSFLYRYKFCCIDTASRFYGKARSTGTMEG